MRRVVLFLMTNFAILLILSFTARILGVDRFLAARGMDIGMLLAFAALIGFGGAFISLLMSKSMAKWSTGARVIDQPGSRGEAWIVNTVKQLAANAGIPMPEVAVYVSRQREYRAGAGASELMGDRQPMIDALRALGNMQTGQLPKEMASSGIAGSGIMALLSSHPPIEKRIAALEA